ncbi:MAG: cryptochrome/photolyase family protein [Cyanophyceae cyanobacterium]
MTIGVWILGDQLWAEQAALASCDRRTPVILVESSEYVQQRPYHRQKLVLVWSAMRHFAQQLRVAGWSVTYAMADEFEAPLQRWIAEHNVTELRIMSPTDRPFAQLIRQLSLPCSVNWIPNNHFLWSADEFGRWAESRKRLVMEDFYREGRQRFQILMAEAKPVGGQWNLDKQNRKPPRRQLTTPEALWFEPDDITRTTIERVKTLTGGYGAVEPFRWGVTRQQAVAVLESFLSDRLPLFGPYQDAMMTGEETMWHALLSPYFNIGLLRPMEAINAAEKAFYDRDLALNSVEGFIRQVLGWREYMHGIYHYLGEEYAQKNWLNHTQPLPHFYWDSTQTEMNCLRQVLSQVERTGYAHHIQRLMVLSNFALIVGVVPQEIENWFHAAFIDAYDWVMQTNVIGMGQFADGGILASKPYASSANYINRMSDYCQRCVYSRRDRTGAKACPFNFFYWDFLARHTDQLHNQGRMNLVLKQLRQMPTAELAQIRSLAAQWRQQTQEKM